MERAISEMEKIRRAEEIYSKRKNESERSKPEETTNVYKFLFKMIILANLVIAVVAVKNRDYIFTKDFLNQVNSCNINIKTAIEGFLKDDSKEEENANYDEEQNAENSVTNSEENSVSGEALENNSALVENTVEEVQEELSQMEIDANEIKEKYSFILPVEGIKTSSFGKRESSNPIVSSNHTGVDIANNKGTVILSATSGKVTLVSSDGDYGKHIKISTDDLTVLYAHCSKIYVKEGDEISQGQSIAEVGSTGNSTGPHLHFEIRYNERYVDPEMVIEL
jgi:murein DD-endopeptidase MepM/ murein hydrolase activator NlpD